MSGRTVGALNGREARTNSGKWTRVYWPPRVDSINRLFIEVKEKSPAARAKGYWPESFRSVPDRACLLNEVHSKASEAGDSE